MGRRAKEMGIMKVVKRDQVRPFKNQPRKFFDQEGLKNLAESIKAIGQLTPIHVRILEKGDKRNGQKYELVDGQRRWHACGIIGKDDMEAIIRPLKSEHDQLVASIGANIRADLTPVETAQAVFALKQHGDSVPQIATVFAKSEVWVYQMLKLQHLHPDVWEMMSHEVPEEERLGISSALLIADLPKGMQLKVTRLILRKRMGVNEARIHVRVTAAKAGIKVGGQTRGPSDDYRILHSFVNRMRREMEVLMVMRAKSFQEMFLHRDPNDRARILEGLDENIGNLRALYEAVEGK